jgi:hypothetical protein
LAAAEPAWSCLATSGRRLVGRLTTSNPGGHEAALAALRSAAGYTRPLAYSSTDRMKLPFALAAIDHVAGAPDLVFSTAFVDEAPRFVQAGEYPELEQLAAFLTGCAWGAASGTTHPVKRTLIDALRARTSLA